MITRGLNRRGGLATGGLNPRGRGVPLPALRPRTFPLDVTLATAPVLEPTLAVAPALDLSTPGSPSVDLVLIPTIES